MVIQVKLRRVLQQQPRADEQQQVARGNHAQ
jgi:hypothetical protein